MRCEICSELIGDNVRWAFEEPYCEECFDNRFNYCSRCDEVISRDDIHYDNDGNPYCDSCWDNEIDSDALDNPEVTEADRELVIHLSRNWLNGKLENKRPISINKKDHHLKQIRERLGLVENPIYLFGLIDRDEYQISASQDIIENVHEFALLNFSDIKVIEGIGCRRLGISLNLRKNYPAEIIQLIKKITSIKTPVPETV